MGKVQVQSVDKEERYEMIGDFFDIVTNLKTKKDIVGFFMGLLTPSEALMLARRIQIAQLLQKGGTYEEIAQKLSTSPTTVNSVAKWMAMDDQSFHAQIEKQVQRKKDKKGKSQKGRYYDRILSPYGQLKLVRDLLEK